MKKLQTIFMVVALLVYIHEYIDATPIERAVVSSNGTRAAVKSNKLSKYSKKCTYSSDCVAHSQCVSGECECTNGWTTENDDAPCGYEQKSKWTAFLLSFFIGNLGADWFYLSNGHAGYIVAGVFKLIISCCCCGSARHTSSKGTDETSAAGIGITSLIGCGSSIWWLVDWIRILVAKFPDGNGVSLYG